MYTWVISSFSSNIPIVAHFLVEPLNPARLAPDIE